MAEKKEPLLGAVDLGSNSFRVEIGRLIAGQILTESYWKETVRLAAGFDDEGYLTPQAQQRALEALARFKEKLAGVNPKYIRAVGTQALRIANGVKAGGASLFRGGAYKPRTSPYSFQGLETEGILDMVKAREATGLPIVSELMSEDRIPEFEEYVDVVQIGARNMQNFQLLKAVGKMHKPVLLKRGLCNTIEEWIMSAEYIMAGGNEQVIFCERGIRTFEKYTRNTLDLSAVPIIHEKTHLPIVVDPSHATGKANLVEPMMIAAVAAGADGLEVEVHYDPQHAWSDGAQCLTPDAFAQAMAKCRQVAWAIGREM